MIETDGQEDELPGMEDRRSKRRGDRGSSTAPDALGVCADQQPADAAVIPRNTARESALADASKGHPPLNSSARCLPCKLAFADHSICPDRLWGARRRTGWSWDRRRRIWWW
jgi:hypothetical protein